MIIVKQLRRLVKEKKNFLFMFVMLQLIITVGIFFLSGVVVNSANVINEDEFVTLRIGISFDYPGIRYGEIEESVIECVDKLPKIINEVSTVAFIPSETSMNGSIMCCSFFDVDNGKYVSSKYWTRHKRRVCEGRFLTTEDVTNKNKVAVVFDYDKEVLGPLVINGEEWDIVGMMYTYMPANATIAYVPISSMEDINVRSVVFSTNTVINDNQLKIITDTLDKTIKGKYKLNRNRGDVPDSKSLARTIIVASAFLLIIVIGTIIILYSYLIKENSYRLGVWKLLGCRHAVAAGLYTLEMSIITGASVLVGFIFFVVIKNVWLVDIYPYMVYFYNWKIYIGIVLGIFISINVSIYVFSLLNTRGKVRKLLA